MERFKGIACALISSATFGLIPLFTIPLMAEGMTESSILFYRFLFSAPLMAVICLIKRESFRISRRQIIPLLILSALYAGTALPLLYAYHYIPSGLAVTIHFLYPILVAFIMIVLFKEKGSWYIFLAAVLSVVGVGFLCWTGADNIRWLGILFAFLSVLAYAVYIVIVNKTKIIGNLSAGTMTFYILTFGMVNFFLYTLFTEGISPIPSMHAVGRLLGFTLFATIISNLTLVMAIKYIGSTITSILGSMEPVVATFVGVICFSEYFDTVSLLGIALIIVSVTLVVLKNSKPDLEPEKIGRPKPNDL